VLVNNTIVILGRVLIEEVIDYSIKVGWFELVNTTYVHYKIFQYCTKLTFMMDGWGNTGKQVVSLRVCPNSCKHG